MARTQRWLLAGFAGVLTYLATLLWQEWFLSAGLRHRSPNAMMLAGLLTAVVGLAWLAALAPQWARRVRQWALRWRPSRPVVRGALALIPVLLFPLSTLYLPPLYEKFGSLAGTLFLYALASLAVAFILAPHREDVGFHHVLGGFLLAGAAYAFAKAYLLVTDYPFSQTWSEGNRMWDYSLLFARERYLYPPDRPIVVHSDPGRMFLWGLVYLIPNVGILGVRLWNAVLFSAPYLLLGLYAFWKPRAARGWGFWAGLWAFLFLVQGPIYAPLVVSAGLLLAAVRDIHRRLPALLVAAGAGFYAALTRFTWMFAPALWAVLWSLATWPDEPARARGHCRRGGALALAALVGALPTEGPIRLARTLYGLMARFLGAGAPPPGAATTFAARQPLLWERLLPNSTFTPGLLLALALAVAPLLWVWSLWWHRRLVRLPRKHLFAILGILGVFFAIGTLASVKIGGGDNLHNFDMFLLGLLVVTAGWWIRGGHRWLSPHRWRDADRMAALLAVLMPMVFVFWWYRTGPYRVHPPQTWQEALQTVRHYVHQAHVRGGEILFVDQRQLLTFGYVEPVPLVPEYEKKYMMDHAMARDAAYFRRFYRDLARHRFALIVSNPVDAALAPGTDQDFSQEYQAWATWIARPMMCFYEPVATFREHGIQLLRPRQTPMDCSRLLPIPLEPDAE